MIAATPWNYKSAVLSSAVRSLLFFVANLGAGYDAAVQAMVAECVFRFATAGFYGRLTQACCGIEPPAVGTLVALVALPVLSHSLELGVHWSRGTPALAASIGASVAFTVVSTTFNLFAMRRGVLVVGAGQRSLLSDVRAIPGLIVLFVTAGVRTCLKACL